MSLHTRAQNNTNTNIHKHKHARMHTCPYRKVVQHNRAGDSNVERCGAGTMLWDIHKRVADRFLLRCHAVALIA